MTKYDTKTIGTQFKYVEYCYDDDQQYNGSLVINGEIKDYFEGIETEQEVLKWIAQRLNC